jgi:hypothetical protein
MVISAVATASSKLAREWNSGIRTRICDLDRVRVCHIGRRTKIFCMGVAQRFERCDKVVGRERLSAAEVPYGCSSPWQYRIRLLFRHGFDFSEAEPISDGKNGGLFVDVLFHYRGQGRYLLHEFVLSRITFMCSLARPKPWRERCS